MPHKCGGAARIASPQIPRIAAHFPIETNLIKFTMVHKGSNCYKLSNQHARKNPTYSYR
jgi:hypothetical protein